MIMIEGMAWSGRSDVAAFFKAAAATENRTPCENAADGLSARRSERFALALCCLFGDVEGLVRAVDR